jgi:hypothetical protein
MVSSGSWQRLVTIMLLGHWLEMASVAKAENALGCHISKLLPDKAEKLVNGKPKASIGKRAKSWRLGSDTTWLKYSC